MFLYVQGKGLTLLATVLEGNLKDRLNDIDRAKQVL